MRTAMGFVRRWMCAGICFAGMLGAVKAEEGLGSVLPVCQAWDQYLIDSGILLMEPCDPILDDSNSFSDWLSTHPEISLAAVPGADVFVKPVAALPALELLFVSGGEVSDGAFQALSQSATLSGLWLSGTQLGDSGSDNLAQLDRLEQLGLENVQLQNDDLSALSELNQLQELYLPSNQITSDGFDSLAYLSQLKALDLSGNPLGPDSLWFLRPHFPLLQELYLDDVGPFSTLDIFHLSQHPPLSVLSLERNGLLDQDVDTLVSGPLLAPAPMERVLSVADNQLTGEGLAVLFDQVSAQTRVYPDYELFIDAFGNPGCDAEGDVYCWRSEKRAPLRRGLDGEGAPLRLKALKEWAVKF